MSTFTYQLLKKLLKMLSDWGLADLTCLLCVCACRLLSPRGCYAGWISGKRSWEFCPPRPSETKTAGIFPAEMPVEGGWRIGICWERVKELLCEPSSATGGRFWSPAFLLSFAVCLYASSEKLSINAVIRWGGLLLITIYCLSTSMKKIQTASSWRNHRDLCLAASKSLVQGRWHGISYFNCKDPLNSWGIFDLTLVDDSSTLFKKKNKKLFFFLKKKT